jgi:hypothetical protein
MVEWSGVSAWISTSRNEAAMTIQVIETKRQPPLWSVKVGKRYVVTCTGPKARAAPKRTHPRWVTSPW